MLVPAWLRSGGKGVIPVISQLAAGGRQLEQGLEVPKANFCFLLESCAAPGNFASVPVAARKAAGVLGAGTEGGNAAGRAGNGLWIKGVGFFVPVYSRAAEGSTFSLCSIREWCRIPGLAL